MRTLYFDCASGISGDMAVAALLDLGADREALASGLASLDLDGYELEIGRASKNGVDACNFTVRLTAGAEHVHSHDHAHEHAHRNLADIQALILASGITTRAKQFALLIFEVVARAEAKIHAVPVEEVNFHEVGAVDSILDIVGASILVDSLGVDRVTCSPLNEGQGMVKCQHGWIPIPAPATLEIARSHNIPLNITQNKGEMVTPTGAAIVAALAAEFTPPREFAVIGVGYGAGKRDYPHTANVLRAMLIDEACSGTVDTVCELSCNLDDIASEALAFACEELMKAGALDVWVVPAAMKKGRPGHVLSLLCESQREPEFSLLLLRHTSTIGVRSSIKNRIVMNRRTQTVQTPYGTVLAKEAALDSLYKVKIEFESAKALALEKNIPISQILSAAYSQLSQQYEGHKK